MIWEEIDNYDDRPLYGPSCGVGPEGHTWRLAFDELPNASLTSGCEDCDGNVIQMVGGEDVYMAGAIDGELIFQAECGNLGGWHGMTRCDCGWSWRFEPKIIEEEEEK